MNNYTITITDKDTSIHRTVTIISDNVKTAHKDAMFYQVNDFDVEEVTCILDSNGDKVFTIEDGFIDRDPHHDLEKTN